MMAAMRGFLLLVAAAHFLSAGGPQLHRGVHRSCEQSGMVHHAPPTVLHADDRSPCNGCPTGACPVGACGIMSPAALSPTPPLGRLVSDLALTLPSLPALRASTPSHTNKSLRL